MTAKNGNEAQEEKVPIIGAVLKKGGVSIPRSEDVEGLSSRGYGTQKDKAYVLAFYEALFLLSKNIIEVKDKKIRKSITFHQLLERYRSTDENGWVRYLVYRDLRSRGYVVREGFGLGIDFRVYQRGEYGKDTAEYLVLGVLEGQPVQIEDLAQTLRNTQNLKKDLILAVLSRKGEIVYYSLSRLSLEQV